MYRYPPTSDLATLGRWPTAAGTHARLTVNRNRKSYCLKCLERFCSRHLNQKINNCQIYNSLQRNRLKKQNNFISDIESIV